MEKELKQWQREFIDNYDISTAQKSLLVSVTGAGKIITTLTAAKRKLDSGYVTNIIVISERKALQQQWRSVARDLDIFLDDVIDSTESGMFITFQNLNDPENLTLFGKIITQRDSLIVFDEVNRYIEKADEISKLANSANNRSKFLYLSDIPVNYEGFDWTYKMDFGREFLYEPAIIHLPQAQFEIVRYSPSLNLLGRLQARSLTLDELSWRQFEKLVSQLLESDGYEVELTRGTKDDGVDIIAVKDMKEAGLYKVVWQAKKNRVSRKIGISTIRELADVRNQFGASKGILVTTSFLTSGALARVHRDRYTLGKVDRNDIEAWINRKLYE